MSQLAAPNGAGNRTSTKPPVASSHLLGLDVEAVLVFDVLRQVRDRLERFSGWVLDTSETLLGQPEE